MKKYSVEDRMPIPLKRSEEDLLPDSIINKIKKKVSKKTTVNSDKNNLTLIKTLRNINPDYLEKLISLDRKISYSKANLNSYSSKYRHELFSFLFTDINNFLIENNIKNIFYKLEIRFIFDLLKPDKELLKTKGFGKHCLLTAKNIIKQATQNTGDEIKNEIYKWVTQPDFILEEEEYKKFLLYCRRDLFCPVCNYELIIEYGCICCNYCGYKISI